MEVGPDRRLRSLRAAAAKHRDAGLAVVTGEHDAGGHWLGTFATYRVTNRGFTGGTGAGSSAVNPGAP